MKQALQAILIESDPEVRLMIMLGKKKITIRADHRDYKVGPSMICCHITPWAVKTDITSVRHTTLAEITQAEMKADGYADKQEMFEDLQRLYPSITLTWEYPMTVFTWGDLDSDSYYSEDSNIKYFAECCGIVDLYDGLSEN